MTTYRLFPSTNGPAAPTNYAGDFISGVVFAVKGGGSWFEGYWWWVCPDSGGSDGFQAATATKCALWTIASNTGIGAVVPGSVVTSGALTAGQWNYIPLAEPVQLAPGYDANDANNGTCYIAAIACNGPFPDTTGFWGTGGAGVSGITEGPLVGFSGEAGGGGTIPAPWGVPQGCFSDTGTDPSVTIPLQSSNVDNFWADVQVSTTAPAGYAGSYRLWPNQAGTNLVTGGDDNVNYTIATEIDISESVTLDNIWYFSPAAAITLATRCDVWNISTGEPVASITSPAWLTAAGASYTAGSGTANGTWIKAAFAGGTVIPAGSYRVSVYNSEGTTDAAWSPKDAGTDYWGETYPGVGSAGITWGPLSAPGWASAQAGYLYGGPDTATPEYSDGATAHVQPVFGMLSSGAVDFPQLFAPVGTGTNETQNYWVDLEATPVAVASGPPDVGIPHPADTEPGVFTGTNPAADVGEPDDLGGLIGEPGYLGGVIGEPG